MNGALLDDGTVLRLPPPEAERLEGWLRPGQMVSVRGDVLDTALGKAIDVRAIGSSPEQMTAIAYVPFKSLKARQTAFSRLPL